MNRYRDICISILKRSLLALPLFVLGSCLMSRAEGDMLSGFATAAFGAAALVAGAIVLAFPLARLIAEPFGNLFYPSRRLGKQPQYSIPQSKRVKGLYEEAIEGFEKLAKEYPQETKPYIEMIDICIVNLKDADRATQIFLRGLSALDSEEDREQLTRMNEAICSRLNARDHEPRKISTSNIRQEKP